MIVLAILGLLGAVVTTLAVTYANGMRSSPGEFQGVGLITIAWLIALILCAGWWVG